MTSNYRQSVKRELEGASSTAKRHEPVIRTRSLPAEIVGKHRKAKETVTARVILLACEILRWTHEKASAVTIEYMRFMHLKYIYDTPDTDSPLGPSYLVDQLWHTHLLDTKSYCMLLSILSPVGGMVMIHHNPLTKEQPDYQVRLNHTVYLYSETFNSEAPAAIWNNTLAALGAVSQSQVANPVCSESVGSGNLDIPVEFALSIRLSSGRVFRVPAKSSDAVEVIKIRIYQQEGFSVVGQSLIFAGRHLANALRLETCYIRCPCTLDLVINFGSTAPISTRATFPAAGSMIVYVLNEMKTYTFDCSGDTTIRNLQEMFEGMTGIDPAEQRLYSYNDERLASTSTLSQCGIVTGDCLDLYLEQGGC